MLCPFPVSVFLSWLGLDSRHSGLVTSIYDHVSFPSPADEQPDWEVEDENTGKMVAIPRPVSSIRIWDPEEKKYVTVCVARCGRGGGHSI